MPDRNPPIGSCMKDSAVVRQQARNLLVLRRVSEARAIVGDLVAADGTDADALGLLAEIEFLDGNDDRARQLARDAVTHRPDATSFLVLASIERRLGDFDAAISACERGLAIEPQHVGLLIVLSMAWAGPWMNDTSAEIVAERHRAAEQSLVAARMALELEPDRPMAHYAMAVAHLAGNDLLAAARALTAGLELRPDWYDGHLFMSAVRARQGMVKLASRHLVAAGRLDPANPEPTRVLRLWSGKRRFGRRPARADAWWLVSEAREILDADRRYGSEA